MNSSLSPSTNKQNTLAADPSFDLHHYLNLLKRYYKQALVFSGLITSISVLFALSITPTFESTVTILIESQEAKAVSLEQITGVVDSSRREYYQTQFEILESRRISELVAEDLKLDEHALFNPSGAKTQEAKNAIVASLMRNQSVSSIRGTQLVKVSYRSSKPTVSTQVANAYARAYIDNHLESKLSASIKAHAWLSERLSNLKLKLEFSEKNLQAFSEKENLLDVKGVKSIEVSQLEQLTAQLIEVRQKKSSVQNTYKQLSSLKQSDIQELLSISSIRNQPLIQQLSSQQSISELKVAELSNRYGALHPKMKAAQSELANLNEKLKLQVKDLVTAYGNETEIVSNMERSVLAQISTSNDEINRINNKNFELQKLQREVEVNRELYNLFLTREKETLGISGFEAVHARVLDKAIIPTHPIAPNKPLIVIFALILSLIIAFVLIFIFDILDNTIKTAGDIETKLQSTILGILPLIREQGETTSGAFTGYIRDKTTSFAESIRTIRTGLLLSSFEQKSNVIVVTSSIPGEGKSTVTVNVAAALGQMDKTLIIDADLRRPSMGNTFEIKGSHPGLSSLIAGVESFETCVIKNVTEGVDLLVSGLIPPNPLELLSSVKFKELLSEHSNTYKHIIIDSAPLQSVSDSLVLSQLASSFIYVVKADETNAGIAKKGLARLKAADAKLSGIVLNQLNPASSTYYDSDNYGGYYQDSPYSTPPPPVENNTNTK